MDFKNDEMYVLGRIAQHLYPGPVPDNLASELFDTLMVAPATGLAMMLAAKDARIGRTHNDSVLTELLQQISDDFADPRPGERVERRHQARFIAGCKVGRIARMQPSYGAPVGLADIGYLLYGWHWEHRMAVGLGMSDVGQIRRWAKGIEPIPLDIWWQLYNQVHDRYGECLKLLPALMDFTEAERERLGLPRLTEGLSGSLPPHKGTPGLNGQ